MNLIQGSGSGKGGGGGGATEVDDTLRSVQYAKIIDAICEGEIEGFAAGIGQSVFFDDTPWKSITGGTLINGVISGGTEVDNFRDCVIKANSGTQAQLVLEGFDKGVEAELSVAAEVKISTGPIVRAINSASINRVRVTIGIPRLTVSDTTNGNISGSSVQYKIAVQSFNGVYVDQWVGTKLTPAGISTNVATTVANSFGVSGNISITNTTLNIVTAVIQVQHKTSASGTWLVLDNRTVRVPKQRTESEFTGSDPTTITIPGSFVYSVAKEDLAANIHNVRVVVISGTVTASLTSCNSTVKSDTVTVTGKTTSRYQQSHEVLLLGTAPYNIRVTRITADAINQATQNQTFWDSYTEIVDTKLNYPNTALIGVSIDASQFKSIPKRSYHVKLKKVSVPTNYFPENKTYTRRASDGADMGTTQIWNGTFYTAWTNNPAWCFYDLVTNTRYGLGEYIPTSWVDKAALYTIGQYCDELVPSGNGLPVTVNGISYSSTPESRFTCNLYLQNQEEAFKVIQNMASIFRAMVYWLGGTLTPIADKPESIWAQFTNADVVDGLFAYQGSANRARHTVALITWNDPKDRFKQKIEYVEDTAGILRYGVNQIETAAMGCTSRGQAHRLGRWLLYSERLETEIITFKASLKGISLVPGKIINTMDQFRSGARNAGRVISSTTTSITIDSGIIIEATLSQVSLEMPDGTIVTRSLTNTPSPTVTHTVLTWTSVLTTQPLNGTIWMVTEASLAPETWRVLSIVEEVGQLYVVNAIAHNTSKFNFIEQNMRLTVLPTSIYSNANIVKAPTLEGLSVIDSIYKLSNDTIATKIHLSWNPSVGA